MLRLLIGVGKCLGLIFFYAALVLLAPSSAWAASTEQPSSSASPSPSDGSSSPPPTDTLSEPPTSDPSSSAPETLTPEPTPAETVTVTETTTPAPSTVEMAGTEAEPMIVEPTTQYGALYLLLGCVSAFCLSVMTVGSFRS